MRAKGPRIFLGGACFVFSQEPPQEISLPPEQSHHIRDVLRLKVGDHLEIGDLQSGVVADAQIKSLEERVVVAVYKQIASSTSPARHVTLLCALCKGEKNDQICDWATELGCHEIHFWQSPRSIVRLRSEDERARKAERLNKIAVAAAQQSRRSRPPLVAVHNTLEEALAKIPVADKRHFLLCSLEPEASPITNTLATGDIYPVVLAVGPEGDFSPEEYKSLSMTHKFQPVTLGSSILRSELAVVTALSAIRLADLKYA